MPRVAIVTSLHGGIVWGGLEQQASRTAEELRAIGWDADFHRPMERVQPDLVHFFGTYEGTWTLAKACLDRGIPYICSPVFSPGVTGTALRFKAFRKRWTDQTSYRGSRRLFQNSQRLICLTSRERQNLTDYFGDLPSGPIIPNGVDAHWSEGDPDLIRKAHALDSPFVLCVGRLDDNKNQLSLIRALHHTGMPLVLIGEAEGPYADACRVAMKPSDKLIPPVNHDDPMLASAYVACEVYCQPSKMEVFSLVALEAMAAGAKLVLTDTWGAEEHFGQLATYCSPKAGDLRRAVVEAHKRPAIEKEDARMLASQFSWQSVALAVEKVYEEVLSAE